MQTRMSSLVEQFLNVGSGFLLSILIWIFIVTPYLGIETDFGTNINVTLIFTVASIARGYLWRRYFNGRMIKKGELK